MLIKRLYNVMLQKKGGVMMSLLKMATTNISCGISHKIELGKFIVNVFKSCFIQIKLLTC